MHLIPYRHYHISSVELQSAQLDMTEIITPEYGRALEQAGPAYTIIDGKDILLCAGLAELWATRAQAWSLISRHATGRKFYFIHRAVEKFLNEQPYLRVEMTVDSDFVNGHRWARLLGFEFEGHMKKYTPNGKDCDLYARVR